MSAAATAAGVATALALLALAQLAPRRRSGMRARGSAAALALLARLGRRVGAPAATDALEARLAAAGRPLGLRAGDAMAAQAGAGALGLLAALPLGSLLPGRLGLLAPFALPLGAFLAPDAWLRRRARRRGAAMARELPDLLDLLRVALGAGLSLERGARHGTPLAEALAAQAAEARAAQARRLAERAAKAAPQIQLVVALLLVPSVLLLVAAALLATFTR